MELPSWRFKDGSLYEKRILLPSVKSCVLQRYKSSQNLPILTLTHACNDKITYFMYTLFNWAGLRHDDESRTLQPRLICSHPHFLHSYSPLLNLKSAPCWQYQELPVPMRCHRRLCGCLHATLLTLYLYHPRQPWAHSHRPLLHQAPSANQSPTTV